MVNEPICIHQVGRYPENPKSRKVGLPTEQMFEVKEMGGKCGTLTTVQKDNLIGEMIPLCTNSGFGIGAKTGPYAIPFRVKEATAAGFTEIPMGGGQ